MPPWFLKIKSILIVFFKYFIWIIYENFSSCVPPKCSRSVPVVSLNAPKCAWNYMELISSVARVCRLIAWKRSKCLSEFVVRTIKGDRWRWTYFICLFLCFFTSSSVHLTGNSSVDLSERAAINSEEQLLSMFWYFPLDTIQCSQTWRWSVLELCGHTPFSNLTNRSLTLAEDVETCFLWRSVCGQRHAGVQGAFVCETVTCCLRPNDYIVLYRLWSSGMAEPMSLGGFFYSICCHPKH